MENVGYNKQLSSKQDVEVIDMNMSNHKENGKLEESRSSLWLHDELDEHEPTRYLWFRDEYSESTECKEAWFDVIILTLYEIEVLKKILLYCIFNVLF